MRRKFAAAGSGSGMCCRLWMGWVDSDSLRHAEGQTDCCQSLGPREEGWPMRGGCLERWLVGLGGRGAKLNIIRSQRKGKDKNTLSLSDQSGMTGADALGAAASFKHRHRHKHK